MLYPGLSSWAILRVTMALPADQGRQFPLAASDYDRIYSDTQSSDELSSKHLIRMSEWAVDTADVTPTTLTPCRHNWFRYCFDAATTE